MPLIVIYNPVCGDRTAKQFFDDHVLPLLASKGQIVDKVFQTERPGHAGEILHDYLKDNHGDLTIVLGSGDGTLHEISNFLSSTKVEAKEYLPFHLSIVLVPCGTANALYSSLFPPTTDTLDIAYKLKGLESFISGPNTIPLTIAITTISSPPTSTKQPEGKFKSCSAHFSHILTVTLSAVVVSTSLHASILHDSEALRKEHPGIERFKIAAANNAKKWYYSHVKLLPTSTGLVQLFEPSSNTFIDHPESVTHDPIVDLYGPFAYFLSTVNVDRLEPAFRITPLARELPSKGPSCDIVIIRPFRGGTMMDTSEAREAFIPTLFSVLGGVYQNGAHVSLRYHKGGTISAEGDGSLVVEYIRCGGWEWIPDDIDEGAHLLCSDGEISIIPKGGRAVCTATIPTDGAGFMVYS
ncbi:ATP-NAD kinase-like domain-containing protein [Desarmillaria tabescens]|uniref:ATP-NAD kinase-like domain-containing protein n=1 Tax=Armillaria tabescens TaxID=1929756 RepID=A0AA39KEV1_ARMTA|nr:ATP-NAD kinase-like domain-containing protein [Desarmillaria tabescens]KAK0459458.1 ATP-NAD kinase-like domain-containing protein [Desarmillaria tabescens]